jgi:hypothetical protein
MKHSQLVFSFVIISIAAIGIYSCDNLFGKSNQDPDLELKDFEPYDGQVIVPYRQVGVDPDGFPILVADVTCKAKTNKSHNFVIRGEIRLNERQIFPSVNWPAGTIECIFPTHEFKRDEGVYSHNYFWPGIPGWEWADFNVNFFSKP